VYVRGVSVSGRYSELPKLTPTGWTILGFLSLYPRTGYQVRQAVQRSVGHFWGVSFGQLYPQLKVLRDAGFITADEAAGDSERRTVWRLTDSGADALEQWLGQPPAPTQHRDEGMVKLMFADHSGPEAMLRLIRSRRDEAQRRHDVAEATVPGSKWPDTARRSPDSVLATWLVRAHTLAVAKAELDWCAEAEQAVSATIGGDDDDHS
jgi:PadR family transcriptional regulator, regulatory protein AphA